MLDYFIRFFSFMSDNQKSLIVPIAISFPLIYTCLYVCFEGFSEFVLFDRAMFAFCGIFAKMYMLYFPFVYAIGRFEKKVVLSIMEDFKPVENDADYKRNLFKMFGIFYAACVIVFTIFILAITFGFKLGVSSVTNKWDAGAIAYVASFAIVLPLACFFPAIIKAIDERKSKKHHKEAEPGPEQ